MEFIQNLKMLNKYEIGEKNVIKLTNGLRFVSVVKQIKAAVRTAEDGLAQRLPSAGKGFYAVFKQTKISLDFHYSINPKPNRFQK